jgi:hypothetical protein
MELSVRSMDSRAVLSIKGRIMVSSQDGTARLKVIVSHSTITPPGTSW